MSASLRKQKNQPPNRKKKVMIHEKALLVKLSIGYFRPRKTDYKVTDTTIKREGADPKSGKFVKNLFPNNPLIELEKHCGEWYRWHIDSTLPWFDDGVRILPSEKFFDYSDKSAGFRYKAETLRDEFLSKYHKYVYDAEGGLRHMFNQADYPRLDVVRDTFQFSFDFLPVPSSQDFRIKCNEDDLVKLRESLESKVGEAEAAAAKDLWVRIAQPIKAMADTLKDPKKRFHDTLVDNLHDILERIPSLNITENADLELLRQEIHEKINGVTPEALRVDKVLRDKTATEADEIYKRITAYL